MARRKYNLSLNRIKRRVLKRPLTEIVNNDLDCHNHSTPIKKRAIDPSFYISELSPIKTSSDAGFHRNITITESPPCDKKDYYVNQKLVFETTGNNEQNSFSIESPNKTCVDHSEISSTGLCEICGKLLCNNISSTSCIHDYSQSALCDRCGNLCEGTRPHIIQLDNVSKELLDPSLYSNLLHLCTLACMKLEKTNHPNFLEDLFTLLISERLKTDGITFNIFAETVKALTVENLSQVRFSKQSKCFWKLVQTKCGGMIIRLLSGWKSVGSLLTCSETVDDVDIIIAIPDEDVLKKFDPYNGEWPSKLTPGLCQHILSSLGESPSVKDSSVCLSLDGKKITPGLKDDKGDINLLGFEENGDSLVKRQHNHVKEQEFISRTNDLIKNVSRDPSSQSQCELISALQKTVTLLTEKSISLDEELKKKTYALEKLKKMGGTEYHTSKYCFVIQLLIATQVELKECLITGQQLRMKLLDILASLNGKLFLQTSSPINMSTLPNYCALHDFDNLLNINTGISQELVEYISQQGSMYIKQRSSAWFTLRKEVKVTGSTVFAASGAGGLKDQREHFLQFVRGKQAPTPSDEAKEAMEHGQNHEEDAMATFCINFLRCFLPDYAVYEVGCVQLDACGIPMLVSPDGALMNTHTGQFDAVLEIKCPYSAKLHTHIPIRYYLQVQAEIMALDVEYAFFVSYKSDATRVFKISRDTDTWNAAVECLSQALGGENKKIPSKLSESSKDLNLKLKTAVISNCSVVAEIQSLSALKEYESGNNTIDFSLTTHLMPDPFVGDIEAAVEDLKEEDLLTLDSVYSHNEKVYQLIRKKATEVVTLVASDTDRLWSKEQVIGAPLCYFLKGYSLSMSVMRNILEEVLINAHGAGIHIPCVAFDGQFMKLLREDETGKPQTILQVQKQHWTSVQKLSKADIVGSFKGVGKVNSIQDMSITKSQVRKEDGTVDQRLHVQRKEQSSLPQTSVVHLHKTCQQPTIQIQDLNIDEDLMEELHQHGVDEFHEFDDTTTTQRQTEGPVSTLGTHSSSQLYPTILSPEDYKSIKADLENDYDDWKEKTIEDLQNLFIDCKQLSKMKLVELKVVVRYLKHQLNHNINVAGTKKNLVSSIKCILNLDGTVSLSSRKKKITSLQNLAARKLQSTSYPKTALNVSYATWTFPSVLQKWKDDSKVRHGMIIPELDPDRKNDWFYIPEFSSSRSQLEVKKIDAHHLLTRHRSAICKGDLGKAKRDHFTEVANDGKTPLKPGMMEQQLNMQSTDFAKITFSKSVEKELEKKGHLDSSYLCRLVREWFEAVDDPGLSAVSRCKQKLRYKDYLLSLEDCNHFPPPGSHIKGYSAALWEATLAGIDADLHMYAITRRRTYNQRALSSQPCESLYSCLATMPGSKNGVPSCVDLEFNMAKICGEVVVRQDPTRGFSTRLSSAPVYPQILMENDVGPLPRPEDPPTFIEQIVIQNHLFDSTRRRRCARKSPAGISNPHEPGKGGVGIRHFHKVNESKLNPLVRAGLPATLANPVE